MLSRCSPLWQSSTIASFSALVIVLHLPKVGQLATCSIIACPFSSLWFLLLQARTFSNKVSLPMGISVLYTMFTTYAAPLASPVIPHPFLFVPAILLFTHCHPPFPSIPNRWQLTFRIMLQDKAYTRPSCLLQRLSLTLVNVLYSVSTQTRFVQPSMETLRLQGWHLLPG